MFKESVKYLNRGFFAFSILFTIYFLIGLGIVVFIKRGDVVLALNSVSSESCDKFFFIITKLGLGGFIAIIGGLFLLYKFRWALLVFINLGLVGLFTNIFKRVFFDQLPRPMFYFYYDDFTRFIYEAPISYFNTFPSGHSLSIFAFGSLMAFLLNNKTAGFFLFTLALLVSISRIYLLQHFFIDTWAGASLGFISTLLTIWVDQKFKLGQAGFLNQNLAVLLKRKGSAQKIKI